MERIFFDPVRPHENSSHGVKLMNTRMNMNMKMNLGVCLLLLTPLLSRGAVIYTEDFSGYDTGNIGGQNDWVVSGTSTTQHVIASSGLSWTSPSGAVSHNGGANSINTLGGTEQYASVGIGTRTDDSIYFSFLVRRNTDGGQFFMLGLTQGALPETGGNVAGAGGYFTRANLNNAGGGRIGSNVFSGGTRSEAGIFTLLGDGDGGPGPTALYVGKLTKTDPSGNYNSLSFTINPDSTMESALTWTNLTFETGLDSVDRLWFRTSGSTENLSIDMLRVGTTFDTVVIPEPGTLVLMGIALGSLLLFRRRRT